MSSARQVSPIYQRFRQFARNRLEKPALVVGRWRLSYGELLQQVDALADGLAAAGIRSGEHVGVLLPNCSEFVLLLLAGARCGLVIVPQSTGLPAAAVEATFRAADVRHLISWAGIAGTLTAATRELARTRVAVGGSVAGWTPLAEVMDTGRETPSSAPLLAADLPYLMVLTSGSTGKPKPIVLSQQCKILRADAAAALYGVSDADITLAATPLYHSLAQRLVLLPLISGGTCVLLEHFTASTWVDAVRQQQVSFSIAVSSQLRQILGHLIATGEPLPSLRCLISSSALLDEETKRALLGRLGCDFHECYGTSEIAIATNLTPTAAAGKLGSVGTAVPGTEVAILDRSGKRVPPGATGEIACRTPMLHSGYYRQPAETAAAMCGDFFRTGDLGRMDDQGFLHFLGRIKDIIITGGVNVYPRDIEEVVGDHPAVKECAAIPLADDQLGEVVGVVIAFHGSPQLPPIREIQRLCAQRLGDSQQPRRFFVTGALPTNAIGKVDKPALRRTYSGKREAG